MVTVYTSNKDPWILTFKFGFVVDVGDSLLQLSLERAKLVVREHHHLLIAVLTDQNIRVINLVED